MPVPFNVVREPTSEVYYTPSVRAGDASYLFRIGDARYFSLERKPQSPFGVEIFPYKPAIFKSTDTEGADWQLLDPDNSIEAVGDIGPTYDCRFASGAAGSPSTLTCIYDATRTYTTDYYYQIYLATFDFASGTWGAPFGGLPLNTGQVAAERPRFSSRPDGKFVFVISMDVGGGFMWGLYGSDWEAFHVYSTPDLDQTPVSLVVDSDNNSHVFVGSKHYALGVDGALLGSEAIPAVPVGPLRVVDGALVYPGKTSALVQVTGSGLTGVTAWSITATVDTSPAPSASNRDTTGMVITESPTGVDLGVHYESNSDGLYSVAGFLSRNAMSTDLSAYWIGEGADRRKIFRSSRSGSLWNAAEVVTEKDEIQFVDFAICAGVGGAPPPPPEGGPVNRYYGW